jgi:hypothetical protein
MRPDLTLVAAFALIVLGDGSGFLGAQAPAIPAPPTPFFDVGACPFEGCAYREWTATRPVDVRRDRRADSPVAFRLGAGERVTAITGVVVTLRAGRVQFRVPQDVSGLEGTFRVLPGETLYLLTYQGEGFTRVWFKGRLYSEVDGVSFLNAICEDDPRRCTGEVVEPSETVWWVQVRNAAGQTGWTNEPEAFDGKSALGE